MVNRNLFLIYLIIFTMHQVVLCGEDFYKLLGVKRTATEQDLKRSFKKLALKYHPDKNKDNPEKAQSMFQKIANAYEILSDPEKRKIYDQKGEEGVKKHEAQQNSGGGSYDDIFSQFFGGGGGGGGFQFHFGGGGGHRQQQQQEPTMLFENSDVFELTLPTLKYFFRRNEVWVILFYKSMQRESKDKKDLWKELAEKYYGVFKVAAVNCETDEELCDDEFEVYGTPCVMGFESKIDSQGKRFSENKGFNIKQLAKFAVKRMENFVNFVSESNYQEWVQMERDKGKVLLFTSAKKTPPLFMALSKEFKNRLSFGEIRSPSTEFQQKFNINKIPTVLVLDNPEQFKGQPYEGETKKDQLSKFLREFANERAKASSRPYAGVVRQLTQEIIQDEKKCSQGDSDFCFIIIYDHDNYNKNKLIAHKLAESYRDDRINFFFIFHNDIKVNQVFPEMKDGPGAVIVRGKRNKYRPFEQGEIEYNSLTNFIDQILGGMQIDKKMGDKLANALKVVDATKNEL